MKHIVLTGGGTAGHVTPNIALIPTLKAAGYQISYIGSYEGIERKLIEEMGIPYYGISSGKLRRYFDPKNFSDPFRVLKGFHEAKKLLKKLKPDVVFSKGGFVTVPVVIAAKRCKIPAIIHESDMTPGLANKLCIPSAVKVCCNFPETVSSLPADKAVLTGTPIRQELMKGDKEAGRQFCGFTSDKPVLMVIGGSLGAASVNDHIRKILPELLYNFPLNAFLLRQEGLHVHRRHLLSEKSLYTHYIYTLHHSTNTHLLPNDQPLLLPEHLQPKLFLWASELPSAQQSAWM